MTFSQLMDYADAIEAKRIVELRERAIAARAAQTTQEDWQKFLDGLESMASPPPQEENDLAAILAAEPKSNVPEGYIECRKLKSE